MPTMYGQAGSYMTAMDPNKAPSSFQWANAYLGASTSLEPGKAMKDLLSLPASGIENVELSVIDPQKFESIPREMFSEARRLGKLLIRDFTKDGRPTPISVHAPMMEATGFSENKFDENQWRATQQHLNSIVEKAALVGPNVPLNVHASQLPADQTHYDKKRAEKYLNEIYMHATEIAPGHEDAVLNSPRYKYTVEMLRKNEIPEVMIAVEPLTGQLHPFQARDHVYPSGEPRRLFPIEQFEMANRSEWDNISNKFKAYWKEMEEAKMNAQRPEVVGTKKAAEWGNYYDTYKDEFEREALSVFQRLNKTAPEVVKALQQEVKGIPEREQLFELANKFKDMSEPPARLFIPAEEFILPKAAETFASAAMRSYDLSSKPTKEMKEAGIMSSAQAPIITIENETDKAFARGGSLKLLVDKSRELFANKLVSDKRLQPEAAKKVAEQIIGATWDVGHINLMKRYGYNEEQIAAEIKAIKKDVKHVHIHDNFGSFDAHLAPGMGNVPIQAILKELQTEGKMPKGIRGIVEAGGYVMNFGENPTIHTLKYFNAPAYNFQGASSWGGESPMAGGYFMGTSAYSAGYGLMLPPIHYSEYGAGFTGLPPSLAAVPGTAQRSQFAGTPNA